MSIAQPNQYNQFVLINNYFLHVKNIFNLFDLNLHLVEKESGTHTILILNGIYNYNLLSYTHCL